MTPFVDPAALRAGDILLMRGIGPVSELIAWFGDSTYSHAAVMIDDAHFVEAAAPVSRRVALADRLWGAYYDFIDVLRPTRAYGEPLDDGQRSAIASGALGCLDVPYPLGCAGSRTASRPMPACAGCCACSSSICSPTIPRTWSAASWSTAPSSPPTCRPPS